jgi:methylated-DNA-protein-cysteine methyltransferase-like protein
MPSRRTSSPVTPARDDERRQRVLAVVDSIPRGRVATYGQVATEAGLPRRARLVGKILATLPTGSRLPWHRVVNASGTISLRHGAGPKLQRTRLTREGVRFTPAGRIELQRYRWTPGG